MLDSEVFCWSSKLSSLRESLKNETSVLQIVVSLAHHSREIFLHLRHTRDTITNSPSWKKKKVTDEKVVDR